MEYYITTPADYWIANNAVSITLNALGDKNRIQGSVASGAVIMCFVEDIKAESAGGEPGNGDGLWYGSNHEPKRWPLSLSPTYFNSDTHKYVYVAIPRSTTVGTQAVIVFPSEQLDIYGRARREVVPEENTDQTEESNDNQQEPEYTYEQIGSTDYFYVYLGGIIGAPSGSPEQRDWEDAITDKDWGVLETAQGREEKQNSSEWYTYSQVNDLVTFLKEIDMKADASWFRNIYINHKRLKDVATSAATTPIAVDADLAVATPGYVQKFYLSKVANDVAAGHITFQQGLQSVLAATFGIYNRVSAGSPSGENTGAAILPDGTGDFLNLIVKQKVLGNLSIEQAVDAVTMVFKSILKSQGATKGIDDGQGIIMDASDGTIETDGLTVRGWMMVRKLIYNYLEIMEQDYQFSGGGDIERVVDNGDGTYTCYIHKEKEGKECSFAPGDILYGKVNENDGNGGFYMYTSWMKAGRCTTGEGRDESGNLNPDTVVVTLWADNMVPGGRNFPPKEFMTVAHRGNVADGYNPDRPDADEHEREQYAMSQKLRQAFWELSTTDHNITHYWNVDQPILREDNYAAVFGIMPSKLQQEVLPSTADFTKPGLYASEIFYEHLTPIKYPAKIVKEDRGDWTETPSVTYNSDQSGTWTPTFDTITVYPDTPQEKTYGLYAQRLAAACGIVQGQSKAFATGDTISDPYHFKTFTLQEWLTERLSASNVSLSDAKLEQKILVEWKKDLEISRVWNRGAIWECLVDGTTQEPWFGCTDWQMINGATFSLGFYSDGETPTPIIGLSVRPGNINETVKPYLLFGQEDISNIVTSWQWERESSNAALDEAWKNSAHVDPDDPMSPLKSQTRTLHITDDDLPAGWDAGDGKVGFKCTATFMADEESQIMNVITIV